MDDIKLFVPAEAGQWIDTEPGIRRRVMTVLPDLMLVEVDFEAGSVGSLHSHPHVQTSYVAAGSFDVTIDGETQRLERGGSFIVPGGLVHGVKALEKGRLIDAFTPHRADFLV